MKSQKNVFVLDITFKSNKLTKMNSVTKSELKRSAINSNKSSSKIILSRKKRDEFRKIKLNNKIKKHVNVLKMKNLTKKITHSLQHIYYCDQK